MKCRLNLTTTWDKAYWIKRDALMSIGNDLAIRESAHVADFYLAGWFHRGPDDVLSFNPPAFYFNQGAILFINGRHRTVLLSRYMDRIPMALTRPDQHDDPTMQLISAGGIDPAELITLPDLPIVEQAS